MALASSQLASMDTRFFVPDLTPGDRTELKKLSPRFVFVAESPHLSEIEPEVLNQRRPLCGAAGKQWWGMLSRLLEGSENSDVSLARLLDLCLQNELVIMNAVQFPLDPKITKKYPKADPVKNLGFAKVVGPYSYKKLKKSTQVQLAISNLKERLLHKNFKNSTIHCLGNDAEWFVLQALESSEASLKRLGEKIPHPSAWWRQGGLFGRIAEERLNRIFNK